MERIVLETGAAPQVRITAIGGDLRLYGWERNEVLAEADDPHDLRSEQEGEAIVVRCGTDCSIRVPRQAQVTIAQVGGDARLKSLGGLLAIEAVGGDVVLRRTLGAALGQVSGDLSAKKVDGPLAVRHVRGDLSARGVAGDFTADQVGGDLYLGDVTGGAQARVGGDAVLNVDFAAGHNYEFQAGGDILCRLAPGRSARISAQCGGDIRVDLPSAQVQGDSNRKTILLGEGAAQASLTAGGDVTLTEASADPEALGEFGEHFGEEFGVMAEELAAQFESQIETQIEAQMADFERQMHERMSALDNLFGPGNVNAEAIAARARRAAERASAAAHRKSEAAQRRLEAAQRKMEAAQRKVERRVEAAQRRAEHGRRQAGFSLQFGVPAVPRPPGPPRPPAPPAEPVSDDERLAILRMVEQGKISVAEAEQLLAALEGKA